MTTFMPHGMCFAWHADILALHVVSDALIAFAYFAIPALMFIFIRARRSLWRVGALFGGFIIACGVTHIMEIWTIWHPDYWLSGSLKALTATISLATVVSLLPLMPYARSLKRVIDLDRINRELENNKRLAEEEARDYLDSFGTIVAVSGHDGGVEYLNSQWHQYTGTSTGFGLEQSWRDCIHPDDLSILESRLGGEAVEAQEFEIRLRRRDGEFRWFLVRGVILPKLRHKRRRWLITATDIEDLKRSQAELAQAAVELEYLVHYDQMTKLPNRSFLIDQLNLALRRAQRDGSGVAVLFLDLDKFKIVNDTFGHATGDRVLMTTGERIRELLRAGDAASRIGGDEFVMVYNFNAVSQVANMAARLTASISAPIGIGPEAVSVGASVGVSVFPNDGNDVEALLRKADIAMYAAKKSGGSTYHVFSSNLHTDTAEMIDLIADLRLAIRNNEFVMHYQPIVHLPSGRVRGGEAVVRWNHPRKGLLEPREFIPFAEEHNLMNALGDIVVRMACEQVQSFAQTSRERPFVIAINVSAQHFRTVNFAETIEAAIADYSVDPAWLELEITETVMMNGGSVVLDTVEKLRALGIRLAIDDFGTGYSSLAYLRRLPVKTLKVDRSFVTDLATNRTDQAITTAIISLAHSMGLHVVAEGVETFAQFAQLQLLQIDSIQGYLISPPLPLSEFARFAQRYRLHPTLGEERQPRITGDVTTQASSLRALRLSRRAAVRSISGDE